MIIGVFLIFPAPLLVVSGYVLIVVDLMLLLHTFLLLLLFLPFFISFSDFIQSSSICIDLNITYKVYNAQKIRAAENNASDFPHDLLCPQSDAIRS